MPLTHVISNHMADIRIPGPAGRRILDRDKNIRVDAKFALTFLHEATHSWANNSIVGITLAALHYRWLQQHFDPKSGADANHLAAVYESVMSLYRPWAEGLALFVELDVLPDEGPNAVPMLGWLQDLLGLTDVALLECLLDARRSEYGIDRRVNTFATRLHSPGGYLDGYLLTKSVWTRARGLEDHSASFAGWRKHLLYDSPTIAALIWTAALEPDRSAHCLRAIELLHRELTEQYVPPEPVVDREDMERATGFVRDTLRDAGRIVDNLPEEIRSASLMVPGSLSLLMRQLVCAGSFTINDPNHAGPQVCELFFQSSVGVDSLCARTNEGGDRSYGEVMPLGPESAEVAEMLEGAPMMGSDPGAALDILAGLLRDVRVGPHPLVEASIAASRRTVASYLRGAFGTEVDPSTLRARGLRSSLSAEELTRFSRISAIASTCRFLLPEILVELKRVGEYDAGDFLDDLSDRRAPIRATARDYESSASRMLIWP